MTYRIGFKFHDRLRRLLNGSDSLELKRERLLKR